MVLAKKRFSLSPYITVLVVCFTVLSFNIAQAETGNTRYVSDYLLINLKTAPRPPFSTVTRIETGNPLEILDENSDYYKVKTINNKIGWVAKRYTTAETPKATIIKELEKKIVRLKNSDKMDFVTINSENSFLQDELSRSKDKISQLSNQLQSLDKLNQTLKTIDPGKFEAMKKLSTDLQAQTSQQQKTIIMLEKNNKTLQNKSKLYWFVAGALVLLIGIIIGKFLNKKQQKSLSF